MKLIFGLIKLFLIAIVLILVFYQKTFPFLLSHGLQHVLGAPVSVESVEVDLLNVELNIHDVKIENPEGFPDGTLVLLSQIGFDLDLAALFKGELRLEELVLNMSELRLLHSPPNGLNLLALKPVKEDQEKAETGEEKKTRFFIETLELSLGKAVYTNLEGPRPIQKSFNINLEKAAYHDIGSVRDVLMVLASEILPQVGVNAVMQEVAESFSKKAGEYLAGLFGKKEAA